MSLEFKYLRPKQRCVSDSFHCTLVKKGYHPTTGVHRPTISVAHFNEYLLTSALESGQLTLCGYVYPVLKWKCTGRICDERWDSIKSIYELELGMDAMLLPRHVRFVWPSRGNDCDSGVTACSVRDNRRIGRSQARILKKGVVKGCDYHEPIISVPNYNAHCIVDELANGVIEFNHMWYLVLDWSVIPRVAVTKKDGSPYHNHNTTIRMRLKTPGRPSEGRVLNSQLDDMLLCLSTTTDGF